jgi:hypothetical protein
MLPLRRIHRDASLQHPYLAAAAPPVPPARELHALLEQQVPQGCACFGLQFLANGLKENAVR